MLTVDFARLPVGPGVRVLDLGCGGGRHAFEVLRRGADVVAFDMDQTELDSVKSMFLAMEEAGEVPEGAHGETVHGNALEMPFEDASFDKVIAAEILEHIPDDMAAMRELLRVLKPGGTAAITVPAFLPERICWALDEAYHTAPGGHVRIYTLAELQAKLKATGFEIGPHHHAHGLHAPYWWIKCAVGVNNDDHPLAKAYHELLVWDIMKRPAATRIAEAVLNPLIGKSVVLYVRKP
ncbi:class I SAM-dependent methyltransferase [Nonomuraea sp. NPDC050663]|uniref:Ubiquinone/menaquinone biosynthesis C-methylase UbiE n=1 Tax=Nonomuraea soli TaxID=1032476 RepID=A0A7W0CN35_9ACTN|nr:class I SAM-dependent methyltransferase [Nonomuraea soli]MBA2894207.1 ubiquinone/menaquinone biosynthesis C-methylase UbiE [Nonomuraea soli]NUT39678.1 class I SAM-dependent methyltransferase [Thermoactinospora sp.]